LSHQEWYGKRLEVNPSRFFLFLAGVACILTGSTHFLQAADPSGKADHAPLLARQAELPEDLQRDPATLALAVLGPDLMGVVTALDAKFDTMENPSEVTITVKEGGILDDDLFGREHRISLARNSRNQWRVIGYEITEQRR